MANNVRVLVNVTYPQLDALHARTGFETIVFGVRSSGDHYTAPIVHATSQKIPTFFDVVVKKPVTDLATSIEAFCLSGVDGEPASSSPNVCELTDGIPLGVIGKLVKHESQLRTEVVALINNKLRKSLPTLDIQRSLNVELLQERSQRERQIA